MTWGLSVGRFTTLLQTEITIGRFAVKLNLDIHSPQRRNLNDPLISPLPPAASQRFHLSFQISQHLLDGLAQHFVDIHCSNHPLQITETALVKIINNLLLAADAGLYSILILIDLRSAFDTVDQHVLISHLKNYVGISDVALYWFIS